MQGELLGFEYGELVAGRVGENQRRAITLDSVSTVVDRQGDLIEGRTLTELISEGAMPLLSVISLTGRPGGTALIPLEHVQQIEVRVSTSNQWKKTGATLGAIGDVTAIIIYLSFVSSMRN